MRIRALNEPETSTDSVSNGSSNEENQANGSANGKQTTLSKEAFEEQCFEKYNQALLAIRELRNEEARELLDELNEELEDELVSLTKVKGLDLACDSISTLRQLKFSVLKNLGNLVDDHIDHYVEALDLDPTDITLWMKAGDRCTKLANFQLARHCYEQTLKLNCSHWVAIDRLMEIYYILHLPFELHDMCLKALNLNKNHYKANLLLKEVQQIQPNLISCSKDRRREISNKSICDRDDGDNNDPTNSVITKLRDVKRKRRSRIQDEMTKFKKTRLCITLDTDRTQSLASFGNYIIKIYERFSRQGLTRNSVIDITLNNSLNFSVQQFGTSNNNSITTNSSQQYNGINTNNNNNHNSSELQTATTTSTSQDVEMVAIEGDGTSASDNDKSNNRNEPPTISSNDEIDQTTKSNSRNRSNPTTYQKGSSLSFAAMLFPMDLGDKRRSSRNRSNQDDTFSFKMKFDEINELFPECLRIGAIEQVLQQRREEQQKNSAEKENEAQEEAILVETNLEPVKEDLIIKDIIESISDSIQLGGSLSKNNLKLCDMFYLYLSKLSAKKQNTLPDAFMKIYKIYRRLCPLPKGIFLEIGQDGITLDEMWFTLTANEIEYQATECSFLLRILEQLQIHIDESQYKQFLVRLFLVLGQHSDFKYLEIALDNIEEDTKVYASNRKIFTRAYIKTLIDRTNEKLQEIENPDDSLEVINRLAPKSENEMSDREITALCAAIKSTGLWQRGLNVLNQRNDLNSDVIIGTINECLMNGATMDAILASKLCKDAISGTRPTTWTCLFRGWLGVLNSEQLDDEDEIERMNKFLELGHQTLGKKNCCTSDKGEFLMLHVAHLLECEHYEERDLFGPMNCLFGYPSKKPASVVSHKAQKVPIIWDYAEIIYPYLAPDELPTYMSLLRKVGITSELEPILYDITTVVPPELDPSKDVMHIENFINKGEELIALEYPKNDVTKDIYYFLADYYFKNKDFPKAKHFYHFDLVINPDRFDSWAASGLIRANKIDKALSEGTISEVDDLISGPFYEHIDSAIRCFEQATKLKPDEPKATLWIEYGNLTYNLASLISRIYKYKEFEFTMDNRDFEVSEQLNERYQHLCELAKRCFKSANTLCQSEEIWLHYYMLGKIYEKTDLIKALEYYNKADAQLFQEGASYPKRISYHSPPDLAYEAMEVHYRIHSCALKFLLDSKKISQDQLNILKRFMLDAQRSPFVTMEGVNDPVSQIDNMIERDVAMLLDDVVDIISSRANYDELIFMGLHGMKRCLTRCDKNFKALYRLSYYYKKIQDSSMAQDILFSKELKTDSRIQRLLSIKPNLPEFKAAPPDLRGIDTLFKDRKLGNLFFNIWRIPVEEVDRPGCFEHWMYKCTLLLIETSTACNDTSTLTLIAFQLSRQPETSKKYLQDKPRLLLARFAVNSIIEIILRAVKSTENTDEYRANIREGMAISDRFIKSNVFPDIMRDLFERLQTQSMAN